MDNVFINSNKKNCVDWDKFQTKVGLRGEKFRFIILALGTTGSGKTDTIKFAKRYASSINSDVIRANQFTNGGSTKSWIDIEVSHDNIIVNNQHYKECVNGVLNQHHNVDNGEDIIANPTAINDMQNCYHKYKTGKLDVAGQSTRRAYGFSNPHKRTAYIKPPVAIKRTDTDITAKKKWGASPLGKTLQAHELDRFVDPQAPLNIRPQEVFNADIVVYKTLTKAIKDGKNIVYESTGKSFNTIKEIIKLANNSCSSNKYNYIVMCTVNIIDKEGNQERIKSRFKQDLGKYQENNMNSAPRIPASVSSLDILENDQNILKGNIVKLIELCTCEKKKKWQEGMDKSEGDVQFVEKEVHTQKKYGQCGGVGIDLLMLFDQQHIDLRKTNTTDHPSAIIPLSIRAKYLVPLTRTGEGSLTFNANEKKKTQLLLGEICSGTYQSRENPYTEEEKIQFRQQATQNKDQLKIELDRQEYRKKLRKKVRTLKNKRGGKKIKRKKTRGKKTRGKRKRQKTRKTRRKLR